MVGNIGIRRVDGELIISLDSSDSLESRCLCKVLRFFHAEKISVKIRLMCRRPPIRIVNPSYVDFQDRIDLAVPWQLLPKGFRLLIANLSWGAQATDSACLRNFQQEGKKNCSCRISLKLGPHLVRRKLKTARATRNFLVEECFHHLCTIF